MNTAVITEQVKRSTGIDINERDMERIFSALLVSGNFWKVVYLSREPLVIVASVVDLLVRYGFATIENEEIHLDEENRLEFSGPGFSPTPDNRCSLCMGRSVSIDRYTEEIKKFMDIQVSRPEAILSYDQAYVTASTVFSRIAIADSRGDLRKRDILILGDDDLMTLALGISGIARKIVTLEIDDRIVDFIQSHGREMKTPVHVEKRDLRRPLPSDMLGCFHTFFCDPPESISGMKLFLQRGLAGMRGLGCSGYFGLTHVESSYSKWGALQKLLLGSGFVITDLLNDFNEYVNWDYHEQMRAWKMAPCRVKPDFNWYRSSLVRVEALEVGAASNEECRDPSIFRDNESSTT